MVNLLLPLLVAALWSIPVLQEIKPNSSHFSDGVLSHLFVGLSSTSSLIAAGICVSLQAILLNRFFNKCALLSRETALPGLIYVCAISYDPDLFYMVGEHVFIILLLLGLQLVITVKREVPALEICFVFGVVVGVGSLFYTFGLLALLLPWIFLSQIRPFKWREYSAPFVGAAFVASIVLSVQLFSKSGGLNLPQTLDVTEYIHLSGHKEFTAIIALLFTIFLILGLRYFGKMLKASTMQFKKSTRAIFILCCAMLSLSAGLSALNYQAHTSFPLALTLGVFATFYLQERRKNWIQVLLFHGWLAVIVFNHSV